MPKDKVIQTLVTKELRDELQKEADAVGMSLSAYLRNVLVYRKETPIYNMAETMKKGAQ